MKSYSLPLLALVSLTLSSNGATLFSEDFSDNLPGPNMALGTGFGSPTTDFTSDFTVTSGASSRIYIGTLDTDYSTIDFVFEADAIYNVNSPWSLAFLGMGSSNADPDYFGEPTVGSDISMGMRPDEDRLVSRDNATTGNVGTANQSTGLGINVVHGMRMEWNATTKLATFLFDLGNDGTYDPLRTFTINGSDNGFTSLNSQLFVGGGNGVTFDNISVTSPIPEPSAALLGGLGVLGLLCRRRK